MQIQSLSRRSFLRVAATTATITTATVTTGCSFLSGDKKSKFTTEFGTLLVMNASQANTLYAFAEAILPAGNGFPDIQKARVIQRADEEISFTEQKIINDVREMLDVMEYLPVFYGQFSRFSKMQKAERLAFLNGLNDTSSETVRAVVSNCRMITYNIYYGHESTWSAIGYDGPFAKVPQQLSEQRQYYAKVVEG